MEEYILITNINDFIFCPRSLYLHKMYEDKYDILYKEKPQFDGKKIHKTIDNNTYNRSSHILTGIYLYCEEYRICGKLDMYDSKKKRLTERKKKVSKIYDGLVFQVYAQYLALIEMGYDVEEIMIYDYDKNKNYKIELPHNDSIMFDKFKQTIINMRNYDIFNSDIDINQTKCNNCIYHNLCDLFEEK